MLSERSQLKDSIDKLDRVEGHLSDAEVMIQMAEEENDADLLLEAQGSVDEAAQKLDKMEFERMLGGPLDKGNCFIEINSGAGGTESQDWANMILRMLTRYGERKGWNVELTNYLAGEEAGIKSATIEVEGEYAFGYLKAENGVHRLVRISPFDSQKRRHTSFAAVSVLPEVDDSIHIDINEADIEMATFRSSGAGGQHVNKTNSAVRLTHIPSGVVVECQAERSQHKNRAKALKLLQARLYQIEMSKRCEERDALYSGKAHIQFGSQIRSYVLQPYQMVKDLRSGYETSDTTGVLDGDLDKLVESFLLMTAGEDPNAKT